MSEETALSDETASGPPRARRRRRLLRLAGALASLLALAAAGVWFLVATDRGAGFTYRRLLAQLPAGVEIGELSGPLRGPVTAREVRYEGDSFTLTAERARIDWRLRSLLGKRLVIEDLVIEGVRLELAESPEDEPDEPTVLPDFELPLPVVVERAALRELTVVPAGEDAEPLRIDEIVLAGEAAGSRIEIAAASVSAPMGNAELAGWIETADAWPLELDLSYAGERDGTRLAGGGRVGGTLARGSLEIEQTLSAPFAAELEAEVAEVLAEPRFDAVVTAEGVALATLDPEWPPLVLSGRLAGEGTAERFAAQGRLDAASAELGDFDARLAVARDGALWQLDELVLELPGRQGLLTASGRVATAGPEPEVALTARWNDLAWPPEGEVVVASPRGTIDAEGTLDAYRLRADAQIVGEIGTGSWQLEARGDRERATIERLTGPLAGGEVAIAGEVGWAGTQSWQLAVSASDVDPGVFVDGYPGAIEVAATTAGQMVDGEPRGSLEIERLGGTLRGEEVAGAGRMEIAGQRLAASDLALSWGTADLTASGSLGGESDLVARLEVGSLEQLLPEASGALTLRARLGGSLEAPRVAATAEIEKLEYAEKEIGRVAAALTARRAAGSDDWSGTLARLDLDSGEVGSWRLAAPADFTAGTTAALVDELCWRSGEAGVCASGGWRSGGPWQADAVIEELPLAMAAPLLPVGVEIEGTVGGRLTAAAGSDGRLDADAVLRPGPGAILYTGPDGTPERLAFDEGAVILDAGPGGATARLSLTTGAGVIAGTATLPGYAGDGLPGAEAALAGTITAAIDDVAPFAAFSEEIEAASGALSARVELGGTLGAPGWNGTAELAGGSATLPRLGIEISEVALTARGAGDGEITVDGSLVSGTGRLEIDGTIDPAGETRLSFSGQRVLAMNTPQVRLVASPELELVANGERLELTGEVRVPEAEIDLSRGERAAVAVSDDIVFVDLEPGDDPDLELATRVRVVLGDEVSLTGSGLEATLGGSVLVIDEPGRPTRASGELVIRRGRFKAYGQDLTVEDGQLLFAGGEIDDPGLDFRAFRKGKDGVVAGLDVEGTLERPVVTVYSEPPMAQDQALSYLILGRPLDQASESEGNAVANAALAMGLKGGDVLGRKIAGDLGLDEARVATDGGIEEAAFVLGKYLTPELYVTYGIGLFDAVNTLRIRYLLSSKWTLQAESGEATGADLLYKIERTGDDDG